LIGVAGVAGDFPDHGTVEGLVDLRPHDVGVIGVAACDRGYRTRLHAQVRPAAAEEFVIAIQPRLGIGGDLGRHARKVGGGVQDAGVSEDRIRQQTALFERFEEEGACGRPGLLFHHAGSQSS
jgi:hypothetical protein